MTMRIIGISFVLTFCLLLALPVQAAYELPRSQVLDLTDTETERNYPIYVQLPPNYTKQTASQFPLVLLTDANYSFPLTSGALRFPMNAGAMQQAILVAVGYAQGDQGQQSRIRDFTPWVNADWAADTGGANAHVRFIGEQLLPYLAAKFRVHGTERTFVGNSLGGLLGAYILAQQPDLFDNYILGSPSFWYHDRAIFDIDLEPSTKAKRVFITLGANENGGEHTMVDDARRWYEKLLTDTRSNVQAKFNLVPGADHATAFPGGVTAGLAWVLAPTTADTTTYAAIENFDLEYEIAGAGEHVILLEAGGASAMTDWDPVFEKLAAHARVIRYARVGNGKSTPVKQHFLSSDYARHARLLLDYLDIDQPVLYVAHSYGGSVARDFAAAYPDRLNALLLLDPSSEHDVDVLRNIDLEAANEEIAAIKLADMDVAMSNQYLDFWSKRPLPDYPEIQDIPVTVIASVQPMDDPPNLFFTDAGRRLWGEQWQAWAEAFPQGKAILTEKSGHFVQFDEPDLVVREVQSLLEQSLAQ